MNIFKILVCMSTILFAAALSAQICKYESIPESTPTDRFTINGNSVVDNITNLEWQRCRLGATWDGSGCPDDGISGNDDDYNWQQALEAAESNDLNGHNDWRVPNIKELASIIEDACTAPNINLEVFPDTPYKSFWSSSPYSGNIDYAMYINLNGSGGDQQNLRHFTYMYVRLVRSLL